MLQTQTKLDHISNLDQTLVAQLQNILYEVNTYLRELKSAFEFVTSSKDNEYNIVIHVDQRGKDNTENRGHYNATTPN